MAQRSSSRLTRLNRHNSPHSQKQKLTNDHRACIYGLLTVILLFCTLAIFQAKIGNPPVQIKDYNNKFHQLGRRSISAFPQVSFSARQLPRRHVVNGKEKNHRQVVDGDENHHNQMINGKETNRLDGDDPHNYGLVGSSLRQETKEDFDLVSLQSLQKRSINDVKIGNVSSVSDKEEEEEGEEAEEEEEEEEEENDEDVDIDGDLDEEEGVERNLRNEGMNEDGKEKDEDRDEGKEGDKDEEKEEDGEEEEEEEQEGSLNELKRRLVDEEDNDEKFERSSVDEGDRDEKFGRILGAEGGNDEESQKSIVGEGHVKIDHGSNSQKIEHLSSRASDDVDTVVNRTAEGWSIKEERRDEIHVEMKSLKSLERHRLIEILPRWDPLEDMGGRNKSSYLSRGPQLTTINHAIHKSSSSQRSGIVWDHLLGVARKDGNRGSSSNQLISTVKTGSGDKKLDHVVRSGHIVGRNGNTCSKCSQIFSSDDEPLDQDIRDKILQVTDIEDALLLRGNKRLWAEKKLSKMDSNRKDRSIKAPIDPLNPSNNPLLQDPDTFAVSGLSGSDKAILKAIRRAQIQRSISEVGNKDEKHENVQTVSTGEKSETIEIAGGVNNTSSLGNSKAAERSILEISTSHPLRSSGVLKEHVLSESVDSPSGLNPISRKWSFFPGLHPALSLTKFIEQFMGNNNCSINVFMAWTTPPWSYSVRYQRGLESLFYFHPEACVVIFSEMIELDFFKSFVVDGFKVAVVQPNLEELLEGTPADVFASVWLTWRKSQLFYIHYTELIRLAALYKYGGVYLDTDVILLKPLNLLHNTMCMEMLRNSKKRLNGAVMAFDKASPFLLECMAEFTATYDDELLDFNGAELLTRVANATRVSNEESTRQIGELYTKSPECFFPLSSENITRYFAAPVNEQQQLETDQSFQLIVNHSLTFHFWNQKTKRIVPQVGSLVERIMNYHCIRCHEYL